MGYGMSSPYAHLLTDREPDSETKADFSVDTTVYLQRERDQLRLDGSELLLLRELPLLTPDGLLPLGQLTLSDSLNPVSIN